MIAVKCGFEGKRGKKPKKAMKPRGRKGIAKALGRRNPETFAVCSNAQMTFSPAVSTNISLIIIHSSKIIEAFNKAIIKLSSFRIVELFQFRNVFELLNIKFLSMRTFEYNFKFYFR